MTDVSLLSSTELVPPSMIEESSFGKDHSLSYLLAFAAVGIFVSIISVGLTNTEWQPDGSVAVASVQVTATR
jgi:hypothetical protein